MNEPTPASSLHEEIALTAELIGILKEEQAHLVAADIQGLVAVTEQKSRVVSGISALTSQRYSRLAYAGFKAMEGGMRAWLDATPHDAEDDSAWAELLRLAQSVKALNNTNGILIGKHMAYNQSALNVLRGNSVTGFYGPDGQTTTGQQRRGVVVG
ncbi:MAG: flagellar protein FlgN [Burkholderiaceae bacterium]|nr:flagellar protein FlgN [Burkholderiaceae bacterium]